MEGDANFLKQLDLEWINGFGFQCSHGPNVVPPRLYLGKIFLAEPNTEKGYDSYEVDTEDVLKTKVIPLLEGWTSQDIWCTDYIGHEFVTIRVSRYHDIARIINTILSIGMYSFRTHNGNTSYTALFRPGMVYSRETHELQLIETLRENFKAYKSCMKFNDDRLVWRHMRDGVGFRQFLKLRNYVTEQGQEFCKEIRAVVGKVNATKPEEKKARVNSDPEDACMICLDNPPTTTVLPCECRVVCDACSKGLRNTPDNTICVRCRRPITHVAYEVNNEMETK